MIQLSRREFIGGLGAGAAISFLPRRAWADEPPRKPNVIVVLADDLGSADVGFQGCKDIPTPHIDSLAANGARCTQGYVSCPVCSPTRAGLLTGRYQQRFGHEFNPPEDTRGTDAGLPLGEVTVVQMLKDAGYVTGHIGKWHLGMETPFRPMERGFTDTYSFLGGGHDYFKQAVDEGTRSPYLLPLLRNGKVDSFKGYLTDALSEEAAAFVRRNREKPFFLYLAYNAPHMPQQAPDKYLDRFARIADEKRRKYAAMVSAIDDGVGLLLNALRETRQEENTLTFFLSDNGGPTNPTRWNGSSNGALRGDKGALWEGGIRVPFVAQWKGKLPPGKTCHAPVISLDIAATAVALAGAKVPEKAPLDGVNLIPHFVGETTAPPHDALFWRLGEERAVRHGDWKLLQHQTDRTPELFSLAEDPGEQHDLAAKDPDTAKAMQGILEAWNAQLAVPRWQRARPRQQPSSGRKGAK